MTAPHRPSRWAQEEGINLTPLLDVIFNLIFFFLVATSLREEDVLDITLPQVQTSETAPGSSKALAVYITAPPDSEYVVRGVPIAFEELTGRILQIADDEEITGVIIKPDENSPSGMLVNLFSAVQEAGFSTIEIDYDQKRESP